MTFFKSLEKLAVAGLITKIEVRAAEDGKLQLYIATAPANGDNKQSIPPVGLKATAEELDAKVPEYLLSYADKALDLSDQFKQADAAMAAAAEAAKERRTAEASKRPSGKPALAGPTSPGKPSGSGTARARDASDGLIDLGGPEGGDDNGGCETGSACEAGDSAQTFLV